jgi:hypothetical protein
VEATEIAAIAIKADPLAMHRDFIVIDFSEGFSFGFAKYSNRRSVSHTPEDWVKLIG